MHFMLFNCIESFSKLLHFIEHTVTLEGNFAREVLVNEPLVVWLEGFDVGHGGGLGVKVVLAKQ